MSALFFTDLIRLTHTGRKKTVPSVFVNLWLIDLYSTFDIVCIKQTIILGSHHWPFHWHIMFINYSENATQCSIYLIFLSWPSNNFGSMFHLVVLNINSCSIENSLQSLFGTFCTKLIFYRHLIQHLARVIF